MRYWVFSLPEKKAVGPFEAEKLKASPGFGPEAFLAPESSTEANPWKRARDIPELAYMFPPPGPAPAAGSPSLAAQADPSALPLAGFWRRLCALLVDAAILGVIGQGLGSVFYDNLCQLGPWGRPLGFLIAIAYFVPLSGALGGGQTAGKRLLGIRLVDGEGHPPSAGRAGLRESVLLLPYFLNNALMPPSVDAALGRMVVAAVVLLIGPALLYLSIFNRRTRQGLHDLAARTYVVEAGAGGRPLAAPGIWVGHYVILGLLLSALTAAGYFASRWAARIADMDGIAAACREIQGSGRWLVRALTRAEMFQVGKTAEGVGMAKTSFVNVAAVSLKPIEDADKDLDELARIVLKAYPDAAKADVMVVHESYGFDIGIAWRSQAYGARYPPVQWQARLAAADRLTAPVASSSVAASSSSFIATSSAATGPMARMELSPPAPSDDYDEFAVAEHGGSRAYDQASCRRRPTAFFFFSPELGPWTSIEEQLSALQTKYHGSQLCFFPIPVRPGKKLEFDETIDQYREQSGMTLAVYEFSSSDMFAPTEGEADVEAPMVVLKTRDGANARYPVWTLRGLAAAMKAIEAAVDDGTPASRVAADDPFDRLSADPEQSEAGTVAKEVQTLMSRRDFGALDRMARQLRSTKARFTPGVWKLTVYYKQLVAGAFSSEQSRKERFRFFEDWIQAAPESPTPRVALGRLWISYAWQARGSGAAKDLSVRQTTVFQDRLTRAAKILEEARGLLEKCPAVFVELLTLARGLGWPRDEAFKLYQQAVAWAPEYQYIHEAMAHYLQPKWNGAPGEWEYVAEQFAKANENGIGDEQYTRLALLMSGDWDFGPAGERLFAGSALSWERVRKGFRDIERRYPGSSQNLSFFAYFACLAGDKETAREVFGRIGENYSVPVWGNRVNFEHWRMWSGLPPLRSGG